MIHANESVECWLRGRADGMRDFASNVQRLAGAMIALAFIWSAACSQGGDDTEESAAAPPAATEEYVAPRYVVPEQAAAPTGVDVGFSATDIDATSWRVKPPFYAAGREPYWRLDLESGWFVFKRLGLPAIEAPIVAPAASGASDVFTSEALQLTLTPGACAQAQVGERTEGEAEILFEDVVYSGCVYAGESPAAEIDPAADEWTKTIALHVIEIDACLSALEARRGLDVETAVITAVYPREGDVTGVVLRSLDGQMFDCGVNALGDIKFADPLNVNAAADWMKGPDRFVRSENEAPPRSCLDAQPVISDDTDGVLGYLLPAQCQVN